MLFTILKECPVGTYKNVTGSDKALCRRCPADDLPHRGVYIPVRGISFSHWCLTLVTCFKV